MLVFRCVRQPPPWQRLPLCGCSTNRCHDFVGHHHLIYAHDAHEALDSDGSYLKQSKALNVFGIQDPLGCLFF